MRRKVILNSLKYLTTIGFILLLHISCHNIKIGYLETRDAIYIPDSMVIKSVLDEVEDADQIKYKIPWQSTTIEGIQGTMPLLYSISKIENDNGYNQAISQFRMVRKGVIEIPWNHTLPSGRYIVSITISNEGYSHQLDSIYTVIVK